VKVVYIYFNYQSKDSQTAVQITKTIIKQLVSGLEIPEELESFYKNFTEKTTNPRMEELISVLGPCSRRFSSIYAVFDALDECDDRYKEEILGLFVNLQKRGYKLLISGRPPLDTCACRLNNVSTLEIRATHYDVEMYIKTKLEERDVRPKVRTKCLELVEGVGGM
jgi:hypothetical protein